MVMFIILYIILRIKLFVLYLHHDKKRNFRANYQRLGQ